jgi:hypothetical protein
MRLIIETLVECAVLMRDHDGKLIAMSFVCAAPWGGCKISHDLTRQHLFSFGRIKAFQLSQVFLVHSIVVIAMIYKQRNESSAQIANITKKISISQRPLLASIMTH